MRVGLFLPVAAVIAILSTTGSIVADESPVPKFSMPAYEGLYVAATQTVKKYCPEAYAARARANKVDVETEFGTLHGAGEISVAEARQSANSAIRCAHSTVRTPTQRARLLLYAIGYLGLAVLETSDVVEKHDLKDRERKVIGEIRAIRTLPAGMSKELNRIEDEDL
jgi:hypothetical protein